MNKWSNEEIEKLILLNKKGLTNEEIAINLSRSKSSIKMKSQHIKLIPNNIYHKIVRKCDFCDKEFESFINEKRKFCSQSCSASYNNKKRKKHTKCLFCGKELSPHNKKYCSQECCNLYKKQERKEQIENGNMTLPHLAYKYYLIEKYGNKCMKCGWAEKNPVTGNVPIELEHIDGDSSNNDLSNLKLLCPNCHSLTPTYKALNKGNGRYKRMKRYKDGKSF